MPCGSRPRPPPSACARPLKTADIPVGGVTVAGPASSGSRACPRRRTRQFRQALADVDLTYDRSSSGRDYTFPMKPNSSSQLREDREPGAADHRAPRQRARRGRADRRAAQRRRPDPGAAAGRDRCEPRQGDHPLDRAPRAEAGRAGAVRGRGAARQAYGGKVPPDIQIFPGAERGHRRRAGRHGLLRGAPRGRGDRPRPAQRAAALDENNRPAVGFSLNAEGRAEVRRVHPANIGRQLGDRARRPRPLGARHRERASTTKAASPATSPSRKPPTSRWSCGRARCRPR